MAPTNEPVSHVHQHGILLKLFTIFGLTWTNCRKEGQSNKKVDCMDAI